MVRYRALWSLLGRLEGHSLLTSDDDVHHRARFRSALDGPQRSLTVSLPNCRPSIARKVEATPPAQILATPVALDGTRWADVQCSTLALGSCPISNRRHVAEDASSDESRHYLRYRTSRRIVSLAAA